MPLLNPIQFRDLMQLELFGLIGNYTFSNELTTPAIGIYSSGDLLPNRTTEGLEVAIRRMPESDRPVVTYSQIEPRQSWQVLLTQWQGIYAIATAKQRIEARWIGTKSKILRIPENQGCLEICSLTVPEWAIVGM